VFLIRFDKELLRKEVGRLFFPCNVKYTKSILTNKVVSDDHIPNIDVFSLMMMLFVIEEVHYTLIIAEEGRYKGIAVIAFVKVSSNSFQLYSEFPSFRTCYYFTLYRT